MYRLRHPAGKVFCLLQDLIHAADLVAFSVFFFDNTREQQEVLILLVGLETGSCSYPLLAHTVAAEVILAAVEVSTVAAVPVWLSGSTSQTCRGTSDGLGWHSGDTPSSHGC